MEDQQQQGNVTEGVILSLDSLEKVKLFEERISFLKPENTRQLSDLQKMMQTINIVYHQELPIEKQRQRVFFDSVFLLKKNPN